MRLLLELMRVDTDCTTYKYAGERQSGTLTEMLRFSCIEGM